MQCTLHTCSRTTLNGVDTRACGARVISFLGGGRLLLLCQKLVHGSVCELMHIQRFQSFVLGSVSYDFCLSLQIRLKRWVSSRNNALVRVAPLVGYGVTSTCLVHVNHHVDNQREAKVFFSVRLAFVVFLAACLEKRSQLPPVRVGHVVRGVVGDYCVDGMRPLGCSVHCSCSGGNNRRFPGVLCQQHLSAHLLARILASVCRTRRTASVRLTRDSAIKYKKWVSAATIVGEGYTFLWKARTSVAHVKRICAVGVELNVLGVYDGGVVNAVRPSVAVTCAAKIIVSTVRGTGVVRTVS